MESYRAAGVRNIMALRGDPREGPSAPWEPTPGGLTYASELVELVRGLGGFSIGVAAFPEGHPAAESREPDARVLVGQGRRRGGLRGHPAVLPGRGLLRARRAGAGRRLRHPDPAGDHADHEPRLGPPDGRAVRGRRAAVGAGALRRSHRARRRTTGRRARRDRAVRGAARRGSAGAALLHAEPVAGDARDLRGAARSRPDRPALRCSHAHRHRHRPGRGPGRSRLRRRPRLAAVHRALGVAEALVRRRQRGDAIAATARQFTTPGAGRLRRRSRSGPPTTSRAGRRLPGPALAGDPVPRHRGRRVVS